MHCSVHHISFLIIDLLLFSQRVGSNDQLMPGLLHIFVSSFFVKTTKIPKIGYKIFISMCSIFACLVCSEKKVNTLLCNILVTWSPKTKFQKWDAKSLGAKGCCVQTLQNKTNYKRGMNSTAVGPET